MILVSCKHEENSNRLVRVIDSTYIINGGIENTIYGRYNTKIVISPNTFVDGYGYFVEDSIKILLSEFYTRKDILLSRIQTTYNNKLLISHGFIRIDAFSQNNETLKVYKKGKIEIEFDTSFYDKRYKPEVFFRNISDSIQGWRKDTSSVFPIKEIIETPKIGYTVISYKNKGYSTIIVKLGWINLDNIHELPAEKKSDLIVNVNRSFKSNVSLVFKDIRSVVSSSKPEDGKIVFQDMPKGERVVLIAYGFDEDGELYVGYKEATIGKDLQVTFEVRHCSKEELEAELTKLDY